MNFRPIPRCAQVTNQELRYPGSELASNYEPRGAADCTALHIALFYGIQSISSGQFDDHKAVDFDSSDESTPELQEPLTVFNWWESLTEEDKKRVRMAYVDKPPAAETTD